MANCDFCSQAHKVDKIKIRGIKKFNACDKCQEIINKAISYTGDAYSKKIDLLENDFSVPRKLINLLYILPYYPRRSSKLKTRRNHFAKYFDYKPSNLSFSVTMQFMIAFFMIAGYNAMEVDTISLTKWLAITAITSFSIGVISLHTGVTSVPFGRTFKFSMRCIGRFISLMERIEKINIENVLIYTAVFLLITIPLYLLAGIFVVALFVLSIALCCVITFIHSILLAVPAYYIDYKRRHIN